MFKNPLVNVRSLFFVVSMIFAALANASAFFVLGRMRSIGHRVGIWRTHKDWALYREYWRVARKRSWSRAPIAIGLLSFVLAACFLLLSIKAVSVPAK